MTDLPIAEHVVLASGRHRVKWHCPEHPNAGTTSVADDREQALSVATSRWIEHIRAVTHRRAA